MTRDAIRQQFGAHAAAYVSSEVHARGASLARMVELTQPQPDWQVLDIATGAGHTAFAFAPHVAHLTAADITPQMLQQARNLAKEKGLSNITVETADAESLPYKNGRFDLVTCRIAPHHFADIPNFISEALRVLRAGGLLAVVDNVVPPGAVGAYINAFEKLRDPSHGRCLAIEEWTAQLNGAGFTIQHWETIAKTLNFSFWAQRHDQTMKSYLLAMLSEATSAAAAFLKPDITTDDASFTLLEALFICQKTTIFPETPSCIARQ